MSNEKIGHGELSALTHVQIAWGKALSNLYRVVLGELASDCVRMTLRRKGHQDWVATVTVVDRENVGELVAFGNGVDALTALAGLNASIGKGKWVVSQPYGFVKGAADVRTQPTPPRGVGGDVNVGGDIIGNDKVINKPSTHRKKTRQTGK